jgi:hypothetical protein
MDSPVDADQATHKAKHWKKTDGNRLEQSVIQDTVRAHIEEQPDTRPREARRDQRGNAIIRGRQNEKGRLWFLGYRGYSLIRLKMIAPCGE